MSEQMLDLAVVRIDGDTQPRTAINPGITLEYAEALQAGAEFPAVTVVHDGASYWLVDGFHRFFAHRRAQRKEIKAEVLTGELAEARWLSLAANKSHGLRRTNEDKAKAIGRALKLRPDMSDREIADHVAVHYNTVGKYRQAMEQQSTITKCDSRSGRDGRTRTTSRIGRGRRRQQTGIAKNAFRPVRTGSAPAKMIALNMPHDPVMGARTLIEVFDPDYLRALVMFLSKHLEGVTA